MIGRVGRARDRRRSARARSMTCAAAIPLLCTLVVASFIGDSATSAWSIEVPAARSARTVKVHDEGRLRFSSSSGSQLIDYGSASGTLPGRVRLHFTYDGSPTVSAQFTISGAGWSIRARAQGRLSNPTSPNPSFRGSLTITGGSGRYAHARGSGELFGVFNRRSYGLTVQAIGKLTY
jgi:hypothetical protein